MIGRFSIAADAAKAPAKPVSLPRVEVDLDAWVQTIVVWFSNHWIELSIAIAVGVGIFLALSFLKHRARAYVNRPERHVGYGAIAARAIARTSKLFRASVAAELVAGFANTPPGLRTAIHFIFTIAVVIQVAVWVREIILGLIERRTTADGESHETLRNAMTLIRISVTVVVFAIAAIMVLDNLGVNVTGLIAGLGVGGIAIGLAAQGIFADLFAALSIIFDKPFRVGETIRYDQTTAKVERIGLKSTRLRALTGEQVVISNTNLLSKEIVNVARLDHRRQTHVLGLTYQTPPEKARAVPAILREIVEAKGAKFVRSGFVAFNASSIDFELVFDNEEADFDTVVGIRHAIGIDIYERFAKEGLEFAYPTQTSFTAAPDGRMILPYPEVQQVASVDLPGDATER